MAQQTSFWKNSPTPGTPQVTDDKASVTLGLQFYSDVAGTVTAVRFYKGSQNTGTHIGQLWSSTGQQLASVTFSKETASGWQQASFSSPVSIQAKAVYVISYLASGGYYADDQNYSWSALSAAPLHVSGSSPGVYRYGSAGFPSGTWRSSNYFVDLVFVAGTQPPPSSTYTISGKVTGSTATLTLSGAAAKTTTTNAAGEYSFTSLKNGSYLVAPSKSGYTFAPSTSLVAINGASVGTVNFTARAGSTGGGGTSGGGTSGGGTGGGGTSGGGTGGGGTSGGGTGGGSSGGSHSVTLHWTASPSSSVTGYKCYRATASGGPYTQIDASLITGTSYVDDSVSAGQTYYYVTTAVGSGNDESGYSNETVAVVPK